MIILWLACLVVIVLVVGFWLSSTAKPEQGETPVVKKGSQSMSTKEKQPKQPKTQPKEQQPKQKAVQKQKERSKVEPIVPESSKAENVAVASVPTQTKKNKKVAIAQESVVPSKATPSSSGNRAPKVLKKKQPKKETAPEREGADSDLLAYGNNFAPKVAAPPPQIVEREPKENRSSNQSEWKEVKSKEEVDHLKEKLLALEADLFMAHKTSETYMKKINDLKFVNARLQQTKQTQEEAMRVRIGRLEEEVEDIKSGKKTHIDDDLSVLNYTNVAAAAPKAAKMQEIMQQEAIQRENERIVEEGKQF